MQVFNAFMKVLRTRIGMGMIWAVVFIIICTAAVATHEDPSEQFSASKVKIAIIDEDNSDISRGITDYFEKNHNIAHLKNDKDVILDALYYDRVNYVLTIKKGCEEKLLAGESEDIFSSYHVHDTYSSVLADNIINEYTSTLRAYLTGGEKKTSAIEKTNAALSQEVNVTALSFDSKDKSGSSGGYFYFQYLPYVLLSVITVTLCPVLIKLGSSEIKKRTACSCITARSQTMQIILASAVYVTAIWLIFIIAGIFLGGGMYSGRMWYAVLNNFIFLVIATGIAILISTFAPSEQAVSVIANILGLGMSFICGIFVPQSMLGSGILSAARFLPAYWYIKVNDILSGDSLEKFSQVRIFEYMGIELLFALAIFAVAVVISAKPRRASKT